MLFDAHNHLQDAWLAPHHARIFADVQHADIGRMVVNGSCQTDWPDVAALAREHTVVRPSFGVHPWDAGNATSTWRDDLRRMVDATPGAAIGEIGIDRWMLDRARPDDSRLAGLRRAPLNEQVEIFLWQLDLAAQRNLPVSIHCLDAWGELHRILREAARPARGFLLHAYAGSAELARDFAALGAYFSFNPSFLAPRHAARRAVFATLPPDRVLAETDAPATPPPEGQRPYPLPGLADGTVLNHPANVVVAYAGLAGARGLRVEVLTAQVEENFHRLFG